MRNAFALSNGGVDSRIIENSEISFQPGKNTRMPPSPRELLLMYDMVPRSRS